MCAGNRSMWFWLAIIALLCWSGSDLFSKIGCRDGRDKYNPLKMVIAVGVVMGIHAAYEIFVGGAVVTWHVMWTYLPVSLLYIGSMTLGYVGLRYIELSISSPICNSSGAVAALLCFFILKETMSGLQFFAVALVCVGVFALSYIEKKQDDALRRREGDTPDKKHTRSFLAILFPILYCIIDGLGTFADALLLDTVIAEEQANIAYELTFLMMAVFAFVYVVIVKKQKISLPAEKPKLGLWVTVAAGVTNMVLDALFMAVFGWGVAGAAIATVLSQIASCVIGFAYMHRRYALLRFSLRELRMDLKTAGRILQVGAPMAIQQSIVSCGFLFLQRLVNYYGESMIASYTVASRMENILMIPIIGIQNTMATFAGQNMGAQRPDRVSKGLGQGVLVSLGMTLILCLAQIAGIPLIIRAFQLDAGAAGS